MKRMNVREFRAKISELNQEPIEVVRYSETVGFWVPISLTTEPKTKIKARTEYPAPTVAEMEKLTESIKKLMLTKSKAMSKLAIAEAKMKTPR